MFKRRRARVKVGHPEMNEPPTASIAHRVDQKPALRGRARDRHGIRWVPKRHR
jgi:hypothetical protein